MTEAEILEMTYEDTFTVERNVKEKDPITGVTITTKKKIYENIKGAVSAIDNQVLSTGDVGLLVYNHKLFYNPRYEIVEGDTITVNRMNKISIYLASKPIIYPSHSVCIITHKERA